MTPWMSFGLNDSPEMDTGTQTIVLLSEHNVGAGLGTAWTSFREGGWRENHSRTFPEQKEKEEIWTEHNGNKDPYRQSDKASI